VKRNLEEEMAAALDGQFFWEKTTKYEDANTGYMAEIRRVQRKFAKPAQKPKPIYVPVINKVKTVDKRIEALKKMPDEFEKLHDAITNLYGVSKRELEGEGPRTKTFPAYVHYVWSAVRYNPNVTVAEIGKRIGRHHSTVIYHRNHFESKKHLYLDNIKIIDDIFDYKGPV
jgi:hypothetical protein